MSFSDPERISFGFRVSRWLMREPETNPQPETRNPKPRIIMNPQLLFSSDQFDDVARMPAFVGTVWDITWEMLAVDPTGENPGMYHIDCENKPFRLIVASEGFMTENGYAGYWTWEQQPEGRLVIRIGGDYPVGWGWYRQSGQQEFVVHFCNPSHEHPFERMRWVRVVD